jgi:hypothetical protein
MRGFAPFSGVLKDNKQPECVTPSGGSDGAHDLFAIDHDFELSVARFVENRN